MSGRTAEASGTPATLPGDAVPRPLTRIVTLLVGVVLAVHGLIHLMGAALEWRLAEVGELRYADAVPMPGSAPAITVGAVWLATAAVFVAAAVLLVRRRPGWRFFALLGAALSAVVIGLHPGPAVAGLVIDGLVLLLTAGTWIAARNTTR